MARIGAKEQALREARESRATIVVNGSGPMTRGEAKDITRRINSAAGSLSELLQEAHDRKAWLALGYQSWREYATGEFTISQSRAYQLLTQAKVQKEIRSAVSTNVEISEGESRVLAPNLSEATAEIRERVDAGEPAEQVLAEVVRKHREKPTPAEPEPPPEDDGPDPVGEWERAERELSEARDTIEGLKSSDIAKKYAELRESYARLKGRLAQETATRNAAESTAKRWVMLLSQIQKAVNARSFDDILSAIQDLRR